VSVLDTGSVAETDTDWITGSLESACAGEMATALAPRPQPEVPRVLFSLAHSCSVVVAVTVLLLVPTPGSHTRRAPETVACVVVLVLVIEVMVVVRMVLSVSVLCMERSKSSNQVRGIRMGRR